MDAENEGDGDRRVRQRLHNEHAHHGGVRPEDEAARRLGMHLSPGSRLAYADLQGMPPRSPLPETFLPTISRGVARPQGLTLLFNDGSPDREGDLPPVTLIGEQLLTNHPTTSEDLKGSGSAYAVVKLIKPLNHHAPGWGEIMTAIRYTPVPSQPGHFCAPSLSKPEFVAIKKLDKVVVDHYLRSDQPGYHPHGRELLIRTAGAPVYQEMVLHVMGRENPYREISRMQELGDDVHVISCMEVLEDDRYLYIVMPHACGRGSLDSQIFRPNHGTVPPEEARKLFIQILGILAYLERHNIHHRDLSPDNFIFLTPDRVVVMDLAMSVRIPVNENGQRTLMTRLGRFGTFAFMSPEIYNNFDVFDGVSSDLWSAMVTLYMMVTGCPLYRLPNPAADVSFRYFIFARGISREPINELLYEVMSEVFNPNEANVDEQRRLMDQVQAHLGLTERVRDLFDNFFYVNPALRWNLAQVMASAYVLEGEDDDDDDGA